MPLLPVDTAIVVTVGPLIDDGDFKTLETAIAYNESGMSVDLITASSSAVTKTDITPTTGGDNDWTHKGNGVYELELTAAQNDTEGTLQIVGVCDGVLPFESPVYTVVPTAVYNSLVAGSDKLQVDAVEISGDSAAADSLEVMVENCVGTDGMVKISADEQDRSGTLHVDAAAISDDTTAADKLETLVETAMGADNKVLISTDEQDLSGTLHTDSAAISDDTTAADKLETLVETAMGADSKVLISTDDQDLNATLHVDAKAISGDSTAADKVETLVETAMGADNKVLISTDEQDLSGTLHVDAAAISDSTDAADQIESWIATARYRGVVWMTRDDQAGYDRYLMWFEEDGALLTSGVTAIKLSVVLPDGTTVIDDETPDDEGGGRHTYPASGAERVSLGANQQAILSATIDGATRTFWVPVSVHGP